MPTAGESVGPAEDTQAATKINKPLEGRRALVTGAGGGLGGAISEALANAGAAVSLMARGRPALEAVAARIAAKGGTAFVAPCDITDISSVASTLGALPSHDIVVNAAGTNRPEPFVGVSLETFDLLFDLNVRALFAVTQLAVRRLLEEKRGGVVINIGSQMGHVGAVNRAVYCATKHAVEGLTKALAVELAPGSIRVVTIAPTFVDTPLTRPFFEDADFRKDVLSAIPLGRLASPDDIAAAVVFLASDSASMVTGTSFVVDGGWTAK